MSVSQWEVHTAAGRVFYQSRIGLHEDVVVDAMHIATRWSVLLAADVLLTTKHPTPWIVLESDMLVV